MRLLPNQLIYAFVGLGLGVIYAQSAFHLDPTGQVVSSAAESIRGLFSVLSFSALVGVAWYFSGKNIELLEAYDRSVEALMTYMEKRGALSRWARGAGGGLLRPGSKTIAASPL